MTRTATLAVAADYADALMTARRAKNMLFFLLTLILLMQLAVFLLVRFNVLKLEGQAVALAPTTAVTQPSDTTLPATPALTATPTTSGKGVQVGMILSYVIPSLDFLGIVLSLVLTVVVLLLVTIMLVGRLIGVSHVTSAFIWSVVLLVFLFPWQSLLIHSQDYSLTGPTLNGAAIDQTPPQPAFKIPGVLYTYPELQRDYGMTMQPFSLNVALKWFRFVGAPVLAMMVLLLVHGKSGRGLRFALGEAEIQVEVTTRSGDATTIG